MMRTTRLPVVNWTDAPADLNGLVRFAKRQNLVSARVPTHFKCSLPRLRMHGSTVPHHGTVASSRNSSLGWELTWISADNVHTQTIFWVAFLHLVLSGLFFHQNYPGHYFLPLTVHVSLFLVKARGQIAIIYMEELWGHLCHWPKFQFHIHKKSEYISTYNSHKISLSFVTLLCKYMVSTEESDKRK